MKLLTGNDLSTGAVVWWTGSDWSLYLSEAIDAGHDAELIARQEEAARRVNAPYVIDGEQSAEGPRPAHIKDRIRGIGPTVRPDLALRRDPQAGSWVI